MRKKFLLMLMALIFFSYKSNSKIHGNNFCRLDSNQALFKLDVKCNLLVGKFSADYKPYYFEQDEGSEIDLSSFK